MTKLARETLTLTRSGAATAEGLAEMGSRTVTTAGLTGAAIVLSLTVPISALTSSTASVDPLSTDAARSLAANVMFGCADSRDKSSQLAMSRAGMAGIVLLGTTPPPKLRYKLRRVASAAPEGREPLFASDEEGGTVQRLGPLIRRLPSAETMGNWQSRRLRRTAQRYARAMARLGVRMSLAPVADLRVQGSYIDKLDRSFGSKPRRVGRAVIAWSKGLRRGGVAPVVKHWPGHGHARDTHQFAASVPAFLKLRRADLVPFRMAFRAGVSAVMVGHVQSRGLTPPGIPATQSARALSVLRRQAGPNAVIMTDSLSMAAASSARGLTLSQAVIESLSAGADWALICSGDKLKIMRAVARAIRDGRLDAAQLQRSAARVAALKESL
ncbi:MAG: glycoside hydrolase family 3 N-terminal domain-containing protein [Candidatus Nanopelagicales bacterium]|nr:glycoside hydrolase family 3 N-terminal domain-containing protein [Candidatus Nanopelagicales bacterium]MDZ4249470.1 glycoside hydrolase family 3 N-terminal domain-containing protein [Candidatus Nanopelagicales bacterium]